MLGAACATPCMHRANASVSHAVMRESDMAVGIPEGTRSGKKRTPVSVA
jgi:hypothetical protein